MKKDGMEYLRKMEKERIMKTRTQLLLWIVGINKHNGKCSGEGECTPDFSCCTKIRTGFKERLVVAKDYYKRRFDDWLWDKMVGP